MRAHQRAREKRHLTIAAWRMRAASSEEAGHGAPSSIERRHNLKLGLKFISYVARHQSRVGMA